MSIRNYLFLLRKMDGVLLAAVFLLVVLGLVMQYSLSLSSGDFFYFKKQFVFALVGLILVPLTALTDFRTLRAVVRHLYVLILVLLSLVLVFGHSFRGVRGWFSFSIFNFQPIELVKIVMVVVLASFWIGRAQEIHRLKYFLGSLVLVAITILLIFLQPDVGSAAILGFLWLGMILIIGPKKKYLILLLVSFLITALFFWLFIFQDYQKDRIKTFLRLSGPSGAATYQVTQSQIAIGSGRFFGRGLGLGPQSQLKFLPEARTDFIFASIAEELGLLGVGLLFFLLFLFFYRLFCLAKKTADDFSSFLIIGFILLFFIEFFVNIAMTLGLLPIVGVALPFLSYGGSSLITSLLAVGILQSIAARQS